MIDGKVWDLRQELLTVVQNQLQITQNQLHEQLEERTKTLQSMFDQKLEALESKYREKVEEVEDQTIYLRQEVDTLREVCAQSAERMSNMEHETATLRIEVAKCRKLRASPPSPASVVPKGTRDRRSRRKLMKEVLKDTSSESETSGGESDSSFDPVSLLANHFWKGPKAKGVTELNPRDPAFTDALSYRRYRLLNTSQHMDRTVSASIGKLGKMLHYSLEDYIFSGETPISILDFLSEFKERCDENGISEGAALLLIPKFLTGAARDNFKSYFGRRNSSLGGFSTYPQAVNHLLRTYATDVIIERALTELDNTVQGPAEDELKFGERLREKARQCGNVFDEGELIKRFIRGVRADVRPLLSASVMNSERLDFNSYVERAYAQGESHRAMRAPPPRKPIIKSGRSTQSVNFMSPPVATKAPGVYAINDHMLPPCQHFSTPTSSSSDMIGVVKPMGTYPGDVRPGWVSSPRPTKMQNPWVPPPTRQQPVQRTQRQVEDTPNDICFDCFAVGHKKPNCPHLGRASLDDDYQSMRKRNFYALHPLQVEWLKAMGRYPIFNSERPKSPLPRPPVVANLPPINPLPQSTEASPVPGTNTSTQSQGLPAKK